MTQRSGNKHRTTVFHIDPMSMRNLARYNFHLLEHLDSDVYYFCSRPKTARQLSMLPFLMEHSRRQKRKLADIS